MKRHLRSMHMKDHFFEREWINLVIIGLFFIIAIVASSQAPQFDGQVITSIENGQVTGYGSVFANILLIPITALLVYVLLLAIPHIAVYRHNVQEFFDRHFGFKIIVLLFLFVIYLAQLMPVFEMQTDQLLFIVPALSVMLFYLGHLLRHLHRNYFFGIKTPWTLSSDKVWNKTHQFGSAVFEVAGALLLLGLIWRDYFVYIMLATVIVAAIVSIVYSYLLFARDHV